MNEIKNKLKKIIETTMIPEVEDYIEDQHKLLSEGTATDDDINVIKEMESFLVELQNIIEAVNTNQISDEQAEEVYENIIKMLEEV